MIKSFRDTRIKLIDKKNEGVSKARNNAINIATGDYIAFMDSDDWMEPNMLELMYKKAIKGQFDVVACDVNAIYPYKSITIKSNIHENKEIKNILIDAYAVIWNKLYKAEFVKETLFKETVTFTEDVLFLYQIYSKINSVGSINQPLYNYLQRDGSITHTYNYNLYQLIENLDDITTFYNKDLKLKKYESEIEYTYIRYLYGTFVKRLAKTKDIQEYKKGVSYVIDKVNERFPNYRENKYIKEKKGKALYLKHFNMNLAKLLFLIEKNKMN